MTHLILFDDARARTFEPFALSRPVSELRAGGLLIRERWETAFGTPATCAIVSPHLELFEEANTPPPLIAGMVAAGSILVNARCAPALVTTDPDADVWECEGRVAAVRCTTPVDASHLAAPDFDLATLVAGGTVRRSNIQGWWLDHVWDLIRFLPDMLRADVAATAPGVHRAAHEAHVLGNGDVVIEDGALIEPHVVFDTSAGPVLVRRGATIAAFTRLVGPCIVGAGSAVLGGKVSGSSIGDVCRVHGEVSATIFVGHANKGHDGFVGHSILGRWTNLGASTVTSNLKNTYGSVNLWTPSGVTDTGMQFLGSLLGDHAKTAIGTRLTTGGVVGAGANVVADGFIAKVVAPFSWGSGSDDRVYDLEKFLDVAGRVMSRRHVELDAKGREHLTRVYNRRWRTAS